MIPHNVRNFLRYVQTPAGGPRTVQPSRVPPGCHKAGRALVKGMERLQAFEKSLGLGRLGL